MVTRRGSGTGGVPVPRQGLGGSGGRRRRGRAEVAGLPARVCDAAPVVLTVLAVVRTLPRPLTLASRGGLARPGAPVQIVEGQVPRGPPVGPSEGRPVVRRRLRVVGHKVGSGDGGVGDVRPKRGTTSGGLLALFGREGSNVGVRVAAVVVGAAEPAVVVGAAETVVEPAAAPVVVVAAAVAVAVVRAEAPGAGATLRRRVTVSVTKVAAPSRIQEPLSLPKPGVVPRRA